MKPFVNPLDISIAITRGQENNVISTRRDDIEEHSYVMDNLLHSDETRQLLESVEDITWVPVGMTGMRGDYVEGDPIYSWRASSYNVELAEALWSRIAPHIECERLMDVNTPTDWDECPQWRAVGVNPLMRFIRYLDGGLLVPHYDAPYIADENSRTLASVVIYLDDAPNLKGGTTRFLTDPQKDVPVTERNLADWKGLAKESDVRLAVKPTTNAGLIFDHRILHDSEPVTGKGRKTIIRTDIMFEKVR